MDLSALRDQVVVEWVLANGRLPGFEERLEQSLPAWEKLAAPRIVYRAQGGSVTKAVEGTDPAKLLTAIRPVLATSKTVKSAARYAGKECCLFEITLPAGTRILDVSKIVNDSGPVSNDAIRAFRDLCTPGTVKWPNPRTGTQYIESALAARCQGREIRTSRGEVAETVPPEDEIMVYAKDVALVQTPEPLVTPLSDGITSYSVKGGRSRGRTFRRTSRRRNKHGRRSTRQSKYHVRDRNA